MVLSTPNLWDTWSCLFWSFNSCWTTSPRTPSPCPSLSAPVCLRPRLFRLHCGGSWESTTPKTHNFVTNFGTQSIQRGCHLANQTAVNSPYPCVSSKNMRGDMVSIGINWYQLVSIGINWYQLLASRCIPHITSKISPLRSWRIFVACPGAGHLWIDTDTRDKLCAEGITASLTLHPSHPCLSRMAIFASKSMSLAWLNLAMISCQKQTLFVFKSLRISQKTNSQAKYIDSLRQPEIWCSDWKLQASHRGWPVAAVPLALYH